MWDFCGTKSSMVLHGTANHATGAVPPENSYVLIFLTILAFSINLLFRVITPAKRISKT